MTLFASLTQDLLHERRLLADGQRKGRMMAIVGDAELDEGNVFEALLEGWKHDVRNVWWVIDYNRQSLDRVVPERLFKKIEDFFSAVGWRVVTLKYGKLLQAAFARQGGDALRQWIDDCPNDLYAALTFKGGAAWRERLTRDLGDLDVIRGILAEHDDAALARLMTNLGGHDLDSVREAFHGVEDDRPHCFIAYTIKGFGLPFAGHKDNHAGLMTPEQMAAFKEAHGSREGEEWSRFAGLDIEPAELEAFLAEVPFAARTEAPSQRAGAGAGEPADGPPGAPRLDPGGVRPGDGRARAQRRAACRAHHQHLARRHGVDQPRRLGQPAQRVQPRRPCRRVQGRARRLGAGLGREPGGPACRARHRREQPVPDAGGARARRPAVRRAAAAGRHALRPVHRPRPRCADLCELPGRPLPAGGDPSGITLAPEGGAHQSVSTPLIGIGQPNLLAFEPAYVDELAVIMRFAFEHLQADDGGSVYLRLSTRPVEQPERTMTADLAAATLAGAYWLREPGPGCELALVGMGAVLPEVLEAAEQLDDVPGLGVLVVTSADRLHADWRAAQTRRAAGHATGPATIERLLAHLAPGAALVTVLDGHPATLAWLGSAAARRVYPLGVERFGQSGDVPDLYRELQIDAGAIVDRAALACRDAIAR